MGTDRHGRDLLSRIILGASHIPLIAEIRELARYVEEMENEAAALESDLELAKQNLSPETYAILENAGCPLLESV